MLNKVVALPSHCEQPNDSQLISMRKQLSGTPIFQPHKACKFDYTIEVKALPMSCRLGVCYNYAMMKTLKHNGISRKFNIIGCQDWQQVLSFFEPVANYQKNDLVVYFEDDNNEQKIKHFGLLIDPQIMRVKSKWGTTKGLFKHDLFNLPCEWGTKVAVVRLKPEYGASGNKQHCLIDYIVTEMENALVTKQILLNTKLELIAFVKNGKCNKIIKHLEQMPNISINIRGDLQQTLLMIAVMNNQVAIVKLLIDYGANKELKDMHGRKALDLALSQGHPEIINLLKTSP